MPKSLNQTETTNTTKNRIVSVECGSGPPGRDCDPKHLPVARRVNACVHPTFKSPNSKCRPSTLFHKFANVFCASRDRHSCLSLEIGRFCSPPRLRRGGPWRSQGRGGAISRSRNPQSTVSCRKGQYSTRNARITGFGASLKPPPCRCAAHPLLISGGEP